MPNVRSGHHQVWHIIQLFSWYGAHHLELIVADVQSHPPWHCCSNTLINQMMNLIWNLSDLFRPGSARSLLSFSPNLHLAPTPTPNLNLAPNFNLNLAPNPNLNPGGRSPSMKMKLDLDSDQVRKISGKLLNFETNQKTDGQVKSINKYIWWSKHRLYFHF